jgi:hypothetical protein
VLNGRLIAGRFFEAQDTIGSAPVAVVSQSFVAELDSATHILGREVTIGAGVPPLRVVGIIEEGGRPRSTNTGITTRAAPAVFVSARQAWTDLPSAYVRVRSRPDNLVLTRLNSIVALEGVAPPFVTLADAVRSELLLVRLASVTLAVAGLFSTLLAFVGILIVSGVHLEWYRRSLAVHYVFGARRAELKMIMLKRTTPTIVRGILGGAVVAFGGVGLLSRVLGPPGIEIWLTAAGAVVVVGAISLGIARARLFAAFDHTLARSIRDI